MAITKTAGYADSKGVVYSTLEAAQVAEMLNLLLTINGTGDISDYNSQGEQVDGLAMKLINCMAGDLVVHTNELLAILTTGPRTRPKARKAAGTTNPRRAAKRATQEQVANGVAAMREAVDTATQVATS